MSGQPSVTDGTRYETLFPLASGGMGTVSVGAVRGALGFRQLVAIKRPHAQLLLDPGYREELISEARLASLIHHANVVAVRDVEARGPDVSLVMDYVEGASVAELLQLSIGAERRVPPGVVLRIIADACAGLHAAHEQKDERGRPLYLVHRDVSPQNLLVGLDGVTRVTDFGVAQFDRTHGTSTAEGTLKGKIAYMAPEYVVGEAIDRRADVFGMAVVLWEALAQRRLFRGAHEAETLHRVLTYDPRRISELVPTIGTAFDAVLATALAKDRAERFETAAAFAAAIEEGARATGLVRAQSDVAAVVVDLVGPSLEERRERIRFILASVTRPSAAPSATADLQGASASQTPSSSGVGPIARSTSTAPPAGDTRSPARAGESLATEARAASGPRAGGSTVWYLAALAAVIALAGVPIATSMRESETGSSPVRAVPEAQPIASSPAAAPDASAPRVEASVTEVSSSSVRALPLPSPSPARGSRAVRAPATPRPTAPEPPPNPYAQ